MLLFRFFFLLILCFNLFTRTWNPWVCSHAYRFNTAKVGKQTCTFVNMFLCDHVKKSRKMTSFIFSWCESLRGWAMALWIYTKRTLWAAEVVCILVQSILVLHWNINSIFWCSFACKATVASLSTEGHGVTFILQSVLKEAWNIPEMAGSVCRFPSCLS